MFWNGSAWTTATDYPEARLLNGGSTWRLPSVDLNTPGNYRVRVIAFDNAGNRANWTDNPVTNFTVTFNDSVAPSAQLTNPSDGATSHRLPVQFQAQRPTTVLA